MPNNPAFLALFAYACWGLVPAYWKQLPGFPSEELILWRVLFSAFSLFPVLLMRRIRAELFTLLRSPHALLGCLLTSLLIGFNWYLYIWAIGHNHVVESSLGYFLNPLVNVALGTLVLKERMNSAQKIACLLAAAGTTTLALQTGHVPWISLLLALSFGFYGFVRKVIHLPTVAATFCETITLTAPSLFVLYFFHRAGSLHAPSASLHEWAWLSLSGLVTTLPLLAFAEAAKHLPLTFMGFLQFLSPSLQFALGVFAYHEPFGPERWSAFALIWLGLGFFLWDLARHHWPRGTGISRS